MPLYLDSWKVLGKHSKGDTTPRGEMLCLMRKGYGVPRGPMLCFRNSWLSELGRSRRASVTSIKRESNLQPSERQASALSTELRWRTMRKFCHLGHVRRHGLICSAGPQFRSFKKAIENPNEKPIEIAAAAAVAPRRWRYFQTEFRSVFQSVF